VLDADAATVVREREHLAQAAVSGISPDVAVPGAVASATAGIEGLAVEVLDRATHEAIERLTASGLLHTGGETGPDLVRSPSLPPPAEVVSRQRLAKCAEWLGGAERKLRMALLLAQGGFADEAMPALNACLDLANNARAAMSGDAEGAGEVAAAAPMPSETGTAPLESLAATTNAVERMLAEVRRGLATPLAA
jgi:hypothetical protein